MCITIENPPAYEHGPFVRSNSHSEMKSMGSSKVLLFNGRLGDIFIISLLIDIETVETLMYAVNQNKFKLQFSQLTLTILSVKIFKFSLVVV